MTKSGQNKKNIALFTAYDEHTHEISPSERNLFIAILTMALIDLQKDGMVGRKAREYFLSNDEGYLFSFLSICDFLEIDPQTILRIIELDDLKEVRQSAQETRRNTVK